MNIERPTIVRFFVCFYRPSIHEIFNSNYLQAVKHSVVFIKAQSYLNSPDISDPNREEYRGKAVNALRALETLARDEYKPRFNPENKLNTVTGKYAIDFAMGLPVVAPILEFSSFKTEGAGQLWGEYTYPV